MVKLFCALAGAGGSAFPVDIDPSQSVGDLKEAIQGKKPRKITCDADELELYLAKRGDAWLTENEVRGMSITNGLKYLGAARAELDAVGLSEKDLRFDIDKHRVAAGYGPVNVLVVVPTEGVTVETQSETRSAKRLKVEEAPDTWMESLKEERVHGLPVNCDEMRAHLERELRVKIPITERLSQLVFIHDTARSCSGIFGKIFEPHPVVSAETATVVLAAVNPLTSGSDFATEDTYHHLWDSLIGIVLRLASSGNFRRNTNSSTSTGLHRPDFCFYYDKKKVCVFRGEEKAKGDMEIPLKELSDKLIWRYDDAPYVFGYAAVGYQVSLVLIRKDATDPRGAFAEVIEEYDLSEHKGRLTFFLALLNLSTLFRPVLQLIRPSTIPEYGVEVRQNGVELYFGKDSVIKEYPASMPSGSIIKKLVTLHTLMAKHRVPNVVTLVKSSMKKKRVELKPIGRAEPPSDLMQLLTALCDILTALVALHSIGVMHRDLRWENVIKYENGPDKWFLIDFDDGELAPSEQGVFHLHAASHAPEISSAHSVKVDIWGVGYLLRTTTVKHLPPALISIRARCQRESPSKRPSAVGLLKELSEMAAMSPS